MKKQTCFKARFTKTQGDSPPGPVIILQGAQKMFGVKKIVSYLSKLGEQELSSIP